MKRILVMVVALGCQACLFPEEGEGPGFYGKLTMAGGSSQSVSTPTTPAAQNPWIRKALDKLIPLQRVAATVISTRAMALISSPPRKIEIAALQERWMSSQVIVATEIPQRVNVDRIRASMEYAAQWDGLKVTLRQCNEPTTCLWRVVDGNGKDLDEEQTREAANVLSRATAVRWVSVNHIQQALAVPNDEYRGLQWHYDQMNLPAAWDVTKGDSNVVAAVIDTGISTQNPDFTGRLGQGADLISDNSISNDGDGRDNNPEDPGDNAAGGGSFHGSHCAGTVGAATDNGKGVAGVSWAGTILAVRVLGIGGGTGFDIAGGIRWAIGEEVEGVTRNTRPADVLSMSLGGKGSSAAEEEAIRAAIARGSLVIVAAGNDNEDASAYTPAGIPEAITVGATRYNGTRASYSNYGDRVDVMAPGGEMSEDADNDGNADGVLSTVAKGVDYLQGTSMATPHVAGLAVLMKTLRPDLRQEEAAQILRETGRTDVRCSECGGAPLVDAAAVVAYLQAGANAPFLSVTPSAVDLGKDENAQTITVRNSGAQALDWSAAFQGDPAGFKLDITSGHLEGRANATIQLSLTRGTALSGDATLVFTSTGGERRVTLHFDEKLPRQRPKITKAFVGALIKKGDELEVAQDSNNESAVVATGIAEGFEYKLQPLEPGEYLILGLTDDNGNGTWEDGEGIGLYPDLSDPKFITLEKDQKITGVDFLVRPSFLGGGGGGGTGCPPHSSQQGDSCVCDPGYTPNDQLTECVPGSGCPDHSSPEGESCVCDPGYIPNDDQTECVPE